MSVIWLKNLVRVNLPIYQFKSENKKFIFAGYSPIKKSYYGRFMLGYQEKPTFLGRCWYWKIPELIKDLNLDFAISEISPLAMNYFQECSGYIIPEWVTMRIDINRPLKDICNIKVSNFSDVKRRIRKYNMTYEIRKEKESFTYFYNRMYKPYITNRYGEEAWIEDLGMILKSCTAPALLVIKENDIDVGASIIDISKESLYLRRLGLIDGNEQYRLHGVIGAMYYFGVLKGQETGCHYLDVGGTRPFLSYGLTKFKLGLGAEFVLDLSPSNVYQWVGINEQSVFAKEFFRNNPFLYASNDRKLQKYGT